MIVPRFPTKLGSDARTTLSPSQPACSDSPAGLVENGHGDIVTYYGQNCRRPPVMEGGVGAPRLPTEADSLRHRTFA
jgi:hypothetical protein